MAFCTKCGKQLDDEAAFCSACGNPTSNSYAAQPPYSPAYSQPQQIVYVRPKIPGRGFSIASMVLSIIGLVYGFSFFVSTIELLELSRRGAVELLPEILPAIILFTVLPVLAICFGAAGRNRNYRGGINTSGLVMGFIGLAFNIVSLLLIVTVCA